jgi:hypothetical protein
LRGQTFLSHFLSHYLTRLITHTFPNLSVSSATHQITFHTMLEKGKKRTLVTINTNSVSSKNIKAPNIMRNQVSSTNLLPMAQHDIQVERDCETEHDNEQSILCTYQIINHMIVGYKVPKLIDHL